jgi:hypothetical protein
MIGNIPTPAQANQQIGNIVLGLRNNFQSLSDFVAWFNATCNTLALVESVFGLSAADAATMQAVVGNLGSFLEIWDGVTYTGPALPFNFQVNSAVLWGGV